MPLPGREEFCHRGGKSLLHAVSSTLEKSVSVAGERGVVSQLPRRQKSLPLGREENATAGEKRVAVAASRCMQYTEVGVPVETPTVYRGPHGLNVQQTCLLLEKGGGVWRTGHPLWREACHAARSGHPSRNLEVMIELHYSGGRPSRQHPAWRRRASLSIYAPKG